MSPGSRLSELEAFGEPARVTVAEEITMWPIEVFNVGMLRSAWGRRNKRNLDMDAYRFKRNLWGVVLCLREGVTSGTKHERIQWPYGLYYRLSLYYGLSLFSYEPACRRLSLEAFNSVIANPLSCMC